MQFIHSYRCCIKWLKVDRMGRIQQFIHKDTERNSIPDKESTSNGIIFKRWLMASWANDWNERDEPKYIQEQ